MCVFIVYRHYSESSIPVFVFRRKWWNMFSAQDKANSLGYYYPLYRVKRLTNRQVIQLVSKALLELTTAAVDI